MADATCTYKLEYYDHKSKKQEPFHCDQQRLEGKDLCLFHDETYLKEDPKNEKEVIKKLLEKMENSKTNRTPLNCIGYYLPDIKFEKGEFKQEVYFAQCKFQEADFSEATFLATASFYGATFLATASFYGATFSDKATFFYAEFSKEANFNGVTFSKEANFSGAKFSEQADFGATFSERADFFGATFSEQANFSLTEFKDANFFDAKFSEQANFSGAKFSEQTNFNGVTFSKGAYFNGAKFSEQANFSLTEFKDANFSGAKFSEQADFSHATFSEQADFNGVTFSKGAYFSVAKFSKGAYFSVATFSEQANFSHAKFSEQANFSHAKFLDIAYCSNATFSKETTFFGAEFKEADFSGATFSDIVNFSKVTFLDKSYFSGMFEDITCFQHVTFESPNKNIFEVQDMSRVSFVNTDITGIRFGDNVQWGGKGKFQAIEETWLKDKDKEITLEGVLSVYRNLRENYELRRRYDDAGKFFIREMELKRKFREVKSKNPSRGYKIKKNCWCRRNLFSLTGWYHLMSNYGESLWRPTVAGMTILFLFTFLFATQSNPYQEPFSNIFSTTNSTIMPITKNSTPLQQNPILKTNASSATTTNTTATTTNSSRFIDYDKMKDPYQWLKSFVRTMGDFIPLLSMPSNIQIGLVDYTIKIVGGLVTFGLIAIALRRRFERKYTH